MNIPGLPAVKIGSTYLVERYHTGEFIGRCTAIDRDVIRLVIVDTLRPVPKVDNRCPFPQCIREDFHAGEHEFARIRLGGEIEVFWRNAGFLAVNSRSEVLVA